jgi:hypothetical protein
LIKGISRRVVVVKSPDAKLFEQAIFILRDDAINKSGTSAEEVMREACLVADQYVRKSRRHRFPGKWLPAVLFSVAGAALTAMIWLLNMLGVL